MTRFRNLPPGWYPTDALGVRSQCDSFLSDTDPATRDCCAVVVPHAGWSFSGALACRTIARITPSVHTVVVVGGHLRSSDPIVLAPEDSIATPLGNLTVNLELKALIQNSLHSVPDTQADNTVEIQLPMIAHLLDMPRVIYVRSPPSALAVQLGKLVADYALSHEGVAVVGSTDLTHYGPGYSFTGHGSGEEAVNWVKTRNDARFVKALVQGDPESIVSVANANRCACSAGAAATAAAFARARGCSGGEVVDYHTSYDVSPGESFVGYVGVGYRLPQANQLAAK